jgi:hypothetical protein
MSRSFSRLARLGCEALEGRLLPSAGPHAGLAAPAPPAVIGSLSLTPPAESLDVRHMALAVKELKGDGHDYVVAADEAADRVWVDHGDSRGLVADAQSGLKAPLAIHLADLNGDGLDDLIVCDRVSDRVFIYLGMGGGQFGAEVNGGQGLLAGNAPDALAVLPSGDKHGPELLVADSGSNDVIVFEKQPKGNAWGLVRKELLQVGLEPTSLLLQDISGTGRLDLVVTNGGDNTISILPGSRDGLFDAHRQRILPTGDHPVQALAADFNGDGRLDLVSVNEGSSDVAFFDDVASPAAVAQMIPTGGVAPVAGLVRDVNGDGRADLIIANYADGRLSLLVGTTTGLTLAQILQESGQHPAALADAAGQAARSFYVMNEGANSATLLQFADEAATPAPAATRESGSLNRESGPLLEENTPVPAELLAPERGPVIDLRPLNPAAVALVPTIVPGPPEPAPTASLPGGQDEADKVPSVVPDAARAQAADGKRSLSDSVPVVSADESVDVHRYLLGVEEVPAPAIGATGASEAKPPASFRREQREEGTTDDTDHTDTEERDFLFSLICVIRFIRGSLFSPRVNPGSAGTGSARGALRDRTRG